MIQILSTGIVLVAAAVGQMMVPQLAVLAHAQVPVLLAAVLYYALTRPTGLSMVIGLVAGLLVDGMSRVPLGYTSALFCAVGAATGLFRNLVFEDTLLTQLCFGAAGAFLATGAMMLVLADTAGLDGCSWWWLTIRLLGTTLLGAGAAPLVFRAARSMDRVIDELTGKQAT